MPVGVAELPGVLPRDVDFDVFFPLRERVRESLLLSGGEVLPVGAEGVTDSVERVASAAPVLEAVLLDAAAGLVEGGGSERDDMKCVRHRDRVVEFVV